MKTVKFYHGTNADVESVLDHPEMKQAINFDRPAFYLTDDVKVAKQYGHKVAVFELPADFEFDKTGPIDRRWEEGLATLDECLEGGREYLIASDAKMTEFHKSMEDCGVLGVDY